MPAALSARNYRLFFVGQSISMIGNWMNQVTNAWLVYHLTGSSLLLGLVGFASQIPNFCLAAFAGVLIDRWSRHRILLVTQSLGMVQSMVLAVLTLTERISIRDIVVLALLQGILNSMDIPARQAFVVEMVDKREDLGSAIALNSSLISMARLTGPAIAGTLIGLVGAGWCYVFDALSYLAVLAALLAMRLPAYLSPICNGKPWGKLREGLVYALGSEPIRAILLLLTSFSFLVISYVALGPVFAVGVLGGGPETLGFLLSASGSGALVAGLAMSLRRSPIGLERILAWAPVLAGLGLIGLGLSRTLWLSLLVLPLIGFSFVLHIASSNTLLQSLVDDDKRGRVMSLYTVAFIGTAPFGNLFAGSLASHIGAPATVAVCGGGCIVAALLYISHLAHLDPLIRASLQSKASDPLPSSPKAHS